MILSTNDEHGSLLPDVYPWTEGREAGGAEALASYVDNVRNGSRCPVFLVSAGDMLQGTLISNLTSGRATIAVMNAIGYDAAAVGNHEFDWGIAVLEERGREARFPLLGANIYLKGTDSHPPWVRPYAIVERAGVRVGVVGAITRSTAFTTHPDSVAELEFRPIAEALERYIPRLRAEGVDFVIAVMHAGGFCEENICSGEALEELAAVRQDLDYAVTGHTHSRVQHRVGGAPVVQSHSYLSAIGHARLTREPTGDVAAELVEIRVLYADSARPAPEIAELLGPFEAEAIARSRETIATLAVPLEKAYNGGSTLGRVIADAQRAAVGADVAIMNNGGIRDDLPAGPVTYGELFRVQPFQNTLIRLRLTGAVLLEAIEHALGDEGPRANLSGLNVEFEAEAPSGARIRCARLFDDRAVEAESTYTLAVNSFMAAGGSGFTMLDRPASSEPTGIVDLDALVGYLRAEPQPFEAPAAARWIATTDEPARCA